MTKRPTTPNRGAADRSAAIVAKCRREIAKCRRQIKSAVVLGSEWPELRGMICAYKVILEFTAKADERAAKVPGGLGRRKTK